MRDPAATDRTFSRDGAALCYRDEGAGPAIVLVHGWPLDLTIWDRQAATLVDRFRVLRLDRRGFGRSAGPPGLREDALDTVALLDHLGIARAAIVAMSQGVRVAARLAVTAPERIACLVLDGAPPLPGVPGGPWHHETPLDEYREVLHCEGIGAVRARLALHPLMQLVSPDPGKQRVVAALLARYTGSDLESVPSDADIESAGGLSRLALPVLILNGDSDSPQRLRVGEALLSMIPGASRGLVPRSGHLACLDNPDGYHARLSQFLTSNLYARA